METRESLVKTRIGHGPTARGVSVQRIQKLADVAPPHQSEPVSPAQPEQDRSSAEKTRWRKFRGKAAALVLLGLVAGFLYYQHASGLEATDDAQVDAHISSVSARVVGTLRAVHVNAHEAVRAGQLLLELDPTDFQIAVDAAHANAARAEAALNAEQPAFAITETGDASTLASTRSELKSAEAALDGASRETRQLRAQLAQADAQSSLATSERNRAVALSQHGALSQAELETRVRFADANRAGANALREQMAASAARVSQREADISAIQSRIQELQSNSPRRLASRRAALEVARANWQVAKAQLAQAEAQLSYTKIYAPAAGIVGAKVVRPGEAIAAGQTLLALCPIDDPWITANFRETQLRNMRPGQRASIYVDALARTFEGRVESIAGATGSRFSLFPPENASGNFVKVVQRVPVKILLAPRQPGLSLLRAGMSVEPSVRTQ
jgi:membrane fusion protein (multidrug efflux system)